MIKENCADCGCDVICGVHPLVSYGTLCFNCHCDYMISNMEEFMELSDDIS